MHSSRSLFSVATTLAFLVIFHLPCQSAPRIPTDTLWPIQEEYLEWHKLPETWESYRGDPIIRVAVLDGSFTPGHDDFDQARFYRSIFGTGRAHGTPVTSILGAESDNVTLMTGIDWRCLIGLYSVIPSDLNDVNGELDGAISQGASIINCSWREQSGLDFPWSLQRKCAEVYQAGGTIIAARGNKILNEDIPIAPACLNDLVIAVGGLNQIAEFHHGTYTGWGTDFVACADDIGVALRGLHDVYLDYGQTSMATPIVSGCASLIAGFAHERGFGVLDYDDIYNLLELGATRTGVSGTFEEVGHGIPRPYISIDYLSFPNSLDRYVVSGPWTEVVETLRVRINLSDTEKGEVDNVIRHALTATASHARPYYFDEGVVHVWANGRSSAGAMRADEVHPDSTVHRHFRGGTVTPNQWGEVIGYDNDQVEVRTYWYEIPGYGSWPSTETSGAEVAVTVLGELALIAGPSYARYDTVNATVTTWIARPSHLLPVDWNDFYMKVGGGDWNKIAAHDEPEDTALLVTDINRGSEYYHFAVAHTNFHQWSGRGPSATVYTRPNPPTNTAANVVMYYPTPPAPEEPLGGTTTMGLDGPGDTTEPVATTEIDVSWSPPENQEDPPAYYEIEAWQVGNWHTVEPCWATQCCPCKTIEYFTDIQSLSQRLCLLLANQQYEFNIYAIGPDGQRSLASPSVLESTGSRDNCNECSGDDPDCVPVAEKVAVPRTFALHPNYPNPFNASTVIGFDLPNAQIAVIDIYNVLGQHVARPMETQMPGGRHQIEWDGRDWQGRAVPSGVYIYQLTAGNLKAVKKMVVLR